MKKKVSLLMAIFALFVLSACHKPGNDTPVDPPTPSGTSEITSENAAPVGFSDEGTVLWDE